MDIWWERAYNVISFVVLHRWFGLYLITKISCVNYESIVYKCRIDFFPVQMLPLLLHETIYLFKILFP